MPAELHQSGVHLDYTPAGAVSAGAVVNLGGASSPLVGIVNNDIAANQKGSVCIAGVYKLDKKSATAMAIGDTVAYDISADEVVPDGDAGDDFDIGKVAYAAGASDASVYVLINGSAI